MSVHPIAGSSAPHIVSAKAADFSKLMHQAKETDNFDEKGKIYGQAFEALSLSEDVHSEALVLEQFVSELVYNQTIEGDHNRGFAQSARLMEFCLLQQLKALEMWDAKGILTTDDPLFKEKDLKAFVHRLEERGALDAFFMGASFNKESLAHKAHNLGMTRTLATTLIRLSYSYQNSSNHNKNSELQKTVQELTESVLGEDPKMAVDYQYNRAMYMLTLNHPEATLDDKMKVFAKVSEALAKLDSNDRFRQGKEAQIDNLLALTCIRANQKLSHAKMLSEKAVRARKALYNSATENSDKQTQAYLLANALTGLLHLMKTLGIEDEDKVKVQKYKALLESHVAQLDALGDQNTYREAYDNAITVCNKLLG